MFGEVKRLVYTYRFGSGSVSEVFLGYNEAVPSETFVVKKIDRGKIGANKVLTVKQYERMMKA